MKPMIFSSDKAFKQLKEEGIVASFRFSDNHEVGEEVWIRRTRNGEKKFEGKVEARIEVAPRKEELKPYWEKSGFDSVEDWLSKIKDYLGKTGFIQRGYLYKVVGLSKLKCYLCGKEYDSGKGWGRFCSKDCFDEWKEENKEQINSF